MTKYQFELEGELETCGDCPFYSHHWHTERNYCRDLCYFNYNNFAINRSTIPSEVGCPLVKVDEVKLVEQPTYSAEELKQLQIYAESCVCGSTLRPYWSKK